MMLDGCQKEAWRPLSQLSGVSCEEECGSPGRLHLNHNVSITKPKQCAFRRSVKEVTLYLPTTKQIDSTIVQPSCMVAVEI